MTVITIKGEQRVRLLQQVKKARAVALGSAESRVVMSQPTREIIARKAHAAAKKKKST